jgi:hypothetical protein
MRRWRELLIVAVLAVLAVMSFAGSFECHVHSGDDVHHSTNAKRTAQP